MLHVATSTTLLEMAGGHLPQPQRLVQLAGYQQLGLGGDGGAVERQAQPAVESKPDGGVTRSPVGCLRHRYGLRSRDCNLAARLAPTLAPWWWSASTPTAPSSRGAELTFVACTWLSCGSRIALRATLTNPVPLLDNWHILWAIARRYP